MTHTTCELCKWTLKANGKSSTKNHRSETAVALWRIDSEDLTHPETLFQCFSLIELQIFRLWTVIINRFKLMLRILVVTAQIPNIYFIIANGERNMKEISLISNFFSMEKNRKMCLSMIWMHLRFIFGMNFDGRTSETQQHVRTEVRKSFSEIAFWALWTMWVLFCIVMQFRLYKVTCRSKMAWTKNIC